MDKLSVMAAAAKQAGAFLLTAAHDFHDSTQKSDVKDFVTAADIRSQEIIRRELKKQFGNEVVILSEEDGEAEHQALYQPGFSGFVIDPIDGTHNFTHDMRESAISIGEIEDGKPVRGVIFDPYKDELFAAEKGRGAMLNGQPMHVSEQANLAAASVATSNGYDDAAKVRNLQRHLGIFEHAKVMPWTSCPGSAVLVMAWVACGRVDAFHHNGLKPWDNAAAFIILQEAGGVVSRLNGEAPNFTDSALLVGNPAIVDELQWVFDRLPSELLS